MQRPGLFRGLLVGPLQGPSRPIQFQAPGEIPPDDLTRVHIGDQRQIGKPILAADIGNISRPGLMGAIERLLSQPVGIDRQPMIRIRGPLPAAPPGQQQAMFPEQVKQPVPAYMEAPAFQRSGIS